MGWSGGRGLTCCWSFRRSSDDCLVTTIAYRRFVVQVITGRIGTGDDVDSALVRIEGQLRSLERVNVTLARPSREADVFGLRAFTSAKPEELHMTRYQFCFARKTWCVRICLAVTLMGASVSPATAEDAVTDWNAFSTELFTLQPSGLIDTRIYSIQHAAIHDALNTIRPRYRRYTSCEGVAVRSDASTRPPWRRPRATCWPRCGRQTSGRIRRWRRPRSRPPFRA